MNTEQTSENIFTNNIPQFTVKHNFFRSSFFRSAVIEWNKLNLNIRNSESLNIFKKNVLKFICRSRNSVPSFATISEELNY